jgi:hypothetical protein
VINLVHYMLSQRQIILLALILMTALRSLILFPEVPARVIIMSALIRVKLLYLSWDKISLP